MRKVTRTTLNMREHMAFPKSVEGTKHETTNLAEILCSNLA